VAMNMTGYEQQILKKMQEEQRCPVCALLEDLEFVILCHLQYDVSNNEDVRTAIVTAGGFCEFHFRRFRKLANSRTNALLLMALIRQYCEHDDDFQAHCRVCERITFDEVRLLEALDSLLPRNDFRTVYEQGPGLCLCHMQKAQRATGSVEYRSWLGQCQITQMTNILPLLQQMVDRSYFDTTRDQRITIPYSVEKFVGRKALGL